MVDRAKKISEVPAVTSVVSTDLFVVVANATGNAVTSRITLGSLANTLGISNTSSANLTYTINKITTSTLSVGNSTINTAIGAAVITSNATLAIGNTTVTGFINATSLNISGLTSTGNTTVTGFINATSLNISGLTSTGNTTVTGFINVSTYGTFGGTVNATSLNISGLTSTGNTTVTGFMNVSTYGTFGGTVNAASLNISGLTTISNTGLITAPEVGNIIPFYFANQAAFPSATSSHGAIAHSHSDGKMYFAHAGSWSAIVSDGTTANVSGLNVSSNTINLNGVTIIRGDASTRLGVNTQIGSTGSNGSIYLSTAGKIYLKVANTGVATDDWQRVTTTAVD
jgi:hypothetical protein